jgi:hypothetical protein
MGVWYVSPTGFFSYDTETGVFRPLPPGEGGGEGGLCDAAIYPSP